MALPLMARTLAWLSLLIPAIPIADRSAPMVVGARHTNRATSDVTDVGLAIPAWSAENTEYAYSETVTNTKIIDRATKSI